MLIRLLNMRQLILFIFLFFNKTLILGKTHEKNGILGVFHKIESKLVGDYSLIPNLYNVLPINVESVHLFYNRILNNFKILYFLRETIHTHMYTKCIYFLTEQGRQKKTIVFRG